MYSVFALNLSSKIVFALTLSIHFSYDVKGIHQAKCAAIKGNQWLMLVRNGAFDQMLFFSLQQHIVKFMM